MYIRGLTAVAAFLVAGFTASVVAPASTAGPAALVRCPIASLSGAAGWAVSPGGRAIALKRLPEPGVVTVSVASLVTGKERVLLRNLPYATSSFVWAPDNFRFAFTVAGELRIADTRTRTVEARLAGRSVSVLDWSPDGKHLLLAEAGKLLLFDVAAETLEELGPGGLAQFLPNGQLIAYFRGGVIELLSVATGERRVVGSLGPFYDGGSPGARTAPPWRTPPGASGEASQAA